MVCPTGFARRWGPKGRILEECLRREVLEEVCAVVRASRFIGCQRVDHPDHPAGPSRYYQVRFWAQVSLLPWRPQHETFERRLVKPADFLSTLSWGCAQTAAITWRTLPRTTMAMSGNA
ncbi:MAG: NUDIX domain-containing protein [Candidatus Dormibacteraceae bacterium]